jgi:ribosome-binding protein aMBF1 (putative translation factor)
VQDDLEDHIAELTRENPELPGMIDAHLERRRLQRALAARRQDLGLSQTEVAARMKTSQSAVARLEAGEMDAKVSTLQRYALAIGYEIEFALRPAS